MYGQLASGWSSKPLTFSLAALALILVTLSQPDDSDATGFPTTTTKIEQTTPLMPAGSIEAAQFEEARSIINPPSDFGFDPFVRTPELNLFPPPIIDGGVKAAPTTIPAKWKSARQKLLKDLRAVAVCEQQELECSSNAVHSFIKIVSDSRHKEGLARIGSVNRSTNLAIRPASDIDEYGVVDYWASPLEALERGAGDCEDYAITKYGILLYIGVPEEDLRLVLVRDTRVEQDHAVLFVNVAGQWRILDNRTFFMLETRDARDYEPLVVLGASTIKVAEGRSLSSLRPTSN